MDRITNLTHLDGRLRAQTIHPQVSAGVNSTKSIKTAIIEAIKHELQTAKDAITLNEQYREMYLGEAEDVKLAGWARKAATLKAKECAQRVQELKAKLPKLEMQLRQARRA